MGNFHKLPHYADIVINTYHVTKNEIELTQ